MDKEKDAAVSVEENKTPEPKTRKQKIRRIMSIAAAVLAALVIFLWLLLDWTVAASVRNVAPVFTGTPVELNGVSIGLLRGRVELNGFKVGNPDGFARPHAFELDKFVCHVDIPSAAGNEVIVKEITISGMLVDYELGLNGSNLAIIQKNVESAIGSAEAEAADEADKADDAGEKKPAKKVIIRKLTVEGVSLAMGAVRIPLPPITMNDLGDGKSLGEVINEFYVALMKAVSDAVSSQAVQGVSDAAKGLGDAAKDAGKNAVDALSNIFKKK